MKRILTMTLLLLTAQILVIAQNNPACVELKKLIVDTYNFKPSRLTDAEREAKSLAMDKVWKVAEAKRAELLPCLRDALAAPGADQWFRFDGSNLLVGLDPSAESKRIQIKSLEDVDLDDVNLQVWVETLARRGFEGFDVSNAGSRWLAYPKARYYLALHGVYEVKTIQGALFIFGSMDESQATPALLKIVNQLDHPGREDALIVLMGQATTESLQSLRQLDASKFNKATQAHLIKLLNKPELIVPRATPKTTRAEFVKAFNDLVNGKAEKFFDLVAEVPDGEKDVVAVLKPEDLPLVRKVRRSFIARSNQHAIEYYQSFTQILLTMTWKPAKP
jgi:hypothetical protein